MDEQQSKKHSIVWWVFIGWWWTPLKWVLQDRPGSKWKKWQKVVLLICGFLIVSILALPEEETPTPPTDSTATQAEDAGDEEEPEEEVAPASFKNKVIEFQPVNPAALQVFVRTTNEGGESAQPSCDVRASDPSRTYSGFDFFELDELAPGDTQTWNGTITIENEGAAFVTEVKVDCDA